MRVSEWVKGRFKVTKEAPIVNLIVWVKLDPIWVCINQILIGTDSYQPIQHVFRPYWSIYHPFPVCTARNRLVRISISWRTGTYSLFCTISGFRLWGIVVLLQNLDTYETCLDRTRCANCSNFYMSQWKQDQVPEHTWMTEVSIYRLLSS